MAPSVLSNNQLLDPSIFYSSHLSKSTSDLHSALFPPRPYSGSQSLPPVQAVRRYRKNLHEMTGFMTTEDEFEALPIAVRRKVRPRWAFSSICDSRMFVTHFGPVGWLIPSWLCSPPVQFLSHSRRRQSSHSLNGGELHTSQLSMVTIFLLPHASAALLWTLWAYFCRSNICVSNDATMDSLLQSKSIVLTAMS